MSDQIAAPTINGKPWYCSKTLWFNLICTALFAAEVNFKVLEGLIPGAVYSALAFVLPVGNMILRFITTTAIIVPKVEQPAPVPPAQAGFLSAGLVQALLVMLVVGALVAAGFVAGRDRERGQWQAKEAAQAKADQSERDRLAKIGQAAAAYEIQEQIRAAERATHLQGVLTNARSQFSLVASRSAHQPAGLSGGAAADPLGACAAQAAPDQSLPQPLGRPDLGLGGDPDLELTLGAVWLWNAALSGSADHAAGACRVDAATGQAAAACAEPSGLDLDAAFANHAANAQACRDDRSRHQRLIDYLNKVSPTPLSK